MREAHFWLDANFFIPASRDREKTLILRDLLKRVSDQEKYALYTTDLVADEVPYMFSQIKTYLHLQETDQKDPQFQKFIRRTSRFTGKSKKDKLPADQSLGFYAYKDSKPSKDKDAPKDINTYIVTDDEGFHRIKNESALIYFNHLEVWEPTEFLKRLSEILGDSSLIEEVKDLISYYFNYFAKYLLENQRGIERLIKSVLVYSEPLQLALEDHIESQDTNHLKILEILRDFLNEDTIAQSQSQKIEFLLPFFEPLKRVLNIQQRRILGKEKKKATDMQQEWISRQPLIKFLYLLSPKLERVLMENTHPLSDSIKGEILRMFERSIAKVRVNETVLAIREGDFQRAFYHFRNLLESRSDITGIRGERLRLIYGIILFSQGDIDFLNLLVQNQYFTEESLAFKTFFAVTQILKSEITTEKINQLDDDILKILFRISTITGQDEKGHAHSLMIQNALFQIDKGRIMNLEWWEDFLRTHLITLRMASSDIGEDKMRVFEEFLDGKMLKDNTHNQMDRSILLETFTPIQKAPELYSSPLYISERRDDNDYIKYICWMNTLRSFVVLEIPKEDHRELKMKKNLKMLKISRGRIRTKHFSIGAPFRSTARIRIQTDGEAQFKKWYYSDFIGA